MTTRSPLWAGPYEDGITQTLLAKFLTCRHRFWLYTVCGVSDRRDFNVPLTYGDAFHNALETYALGRVSPKVAGERIKDYFHQQYRLHPEQAREAAKWSRIAYDQFLAYCSVWQDEDRRFTSLLEEQVFNIPYTLPSGRVIRLRGKWDGMIQSGDRLQSVYLFEHKIKGDIDSEHLTETLPQNLQVMFYLIPLRIYCQDQGLPPPEGVLYNVVQRPLAGKKHSIKPRKGRRVKVKGNEGYEIKGAETQEQFFQRLATLYSQYPHDFFFRWRVCIPETEIQRFRRESLDPALEQMCDWWDSISSDPFDPWTTPMAVPVFPLESSDRDILSPTKVPNPLHFRRPFGIYDPLAKGLVGEYQQYLVAGDKSSLQRVLTVFPELEAGRLSDRRLRR